ncbi:MAG: hypothetical protein WCE30_10845 [Mycobacterium sp.]
MENARDTAAELSSARSGRALALASHIADAIALCERITLYAKADAITHNACAFAEEHTELSVLTDYMIETGRRYQ